jgi:hypothetical protein
LARTLHIDGQALQDQMHLPRCGFRYLDLLHQRIEFSEHDGQFVDQDAGLLLKRQMGVTFQSSGRIDYSRLVFVKR